MVDSLPHNTRHLPAVSPDLVLVRWGHGEWQVRNLSDRLSLWLGLDLSAAQGRSLRHLFPSSVPAISDLAAEVLETGVDLTGIKLLLVPEQPEFLADIQFAGLTEDYLGQLVRVVLRRESVASQQDIGFRNLIGSSPAMRELFSLISR